VLQNEDENINASTVKALRNIKGIIDIVPIGSKGINYEAENIGNFRNLNLKYYEKEVNIYKSSGPSTCCIATVDKNIVDLKEIKKSLNKPVEIIGIYE